MFPNHYYLCDKNRGMPLYFYTQFFQPHILAVPVAVQGCQVLTTAVLQQPGDVIRSSCEAVSSQLIPANSSYYIHDHQQQETFRSNGLTPAVREMLVPIPDDYKFSFIKKIDEVGPRCSRSSPKPVAPPKRAPPKRAPPAPLGSTPRRQKRRRMLIITKTRKINFDLPEE